MLEEISEPEDPRAETNGPSNTKSDSVASDGSPSSPPVSSNLTTAGGGASNLSVIKRGASGPLRERGKARSKYNAIKHGIFSKVVFLKGEPRKEFDSLVNGFRNDLRPEGPLEETLVEKLASLVWRYRRMLIAERAEIQRGTKSAWKEFVSHQQAATMALKTNSKGDKQPGLMVGIENPLILARCLDRLQLLKNLILKRGEHPETDSAILSEVFGELDFDLALYYASANLPPPTCEFEFAEDEDTAIQPEDKRGQLHEDKKGAEGSGVLKKVDGSGVLKYLQGYIDKLEGRARAMGAPKGKLEELWRNVPEAPRLDRLLRYEASLERAFDRTLTQLERLQRMRKGQPVQPKEEISLSIA